MPTLLVWYVLHFSWRLSSSPFSTPLLLPLLPASPLRLKLSPSGLARIPAPLPFSDNQLHPLLAEAGRPLAFLCSYRRMVGDPWEVGSPYLAAHIGNLLPTNTNSCARSRAPSVTNQFKERVENAERLLIRFKFIVDIEKRLYAVQSAARSIGLTSSSAVK